MKPGFPGSRWRFTARTLLLGGTLWLMLESEVRAAAAHTGASSGYGLRAQLKILTLDASPDPIGPSQGTAPPAYAVSESLVPLNLDLGIPLVLDVLDSEGMVESGASSTVGSGVPAPVTTGRGGAAGLELSLARILGVLGGPALLEVEADSVTSESTVSHTPAGLAAGGGAQVAGLKLRVAGSALPVTVEANPAPNTVVALGDPRLAGVTLILNEQTLTASQGRVTVARNALSLKLDAVAVGSLGLLSGVIEIGHSEAEMRLDSDGDGQFDEVDTDDDGDGLPDAVETDSNGNDRDTDGDGIPDRLDPDSDQDGIPDGTETGGDTDGDGIPDYQDPDSDNDGIPDGTETGGDTDGDGTPDYRDTDSDGDGIPDTTETAADPDGDGKGNHVDTDSDSDGIPDRQETAADPDGDTRGSHVDLDSDNDGINDVQEAGLTDADGNGRVDGPSSTVPAAVVVLPDSDGDLVPDYLDLDSDNDTISDVVETAGSASDPDASGMLGGPDTDGDGIRDVADGSPLFGDAGSQPLRNSDSTDFPDFLDTDSDNSGSPDIAAVGNAGLDVNGDGRAEVAGADPDGDGIVLAVDTKPAAYGGISTTFVSPQQWQQEHFTPAERDQPEVSGWDSDPDRDGAPNVQEYAQGTLPKDSSSFKPVVSTLVPAPGGGSTLGLESEKAPGARVWVGVEVSSTLADGWVKDPELFEITEETAVKLSGRGTSGTGAVPRLFARLRFLLAE